jgi:hypothetical protein
VLNRRRKKWLSVCCVVLVAPFLFLVAERVRGQKSLANYLRQLASQGEKLTIDELFTPASEGPNGVSELMNAFERLVPGTVLLEHTPPLMRIVPSGRAMVGFAESDWAEGEQKFDWQQLSADLQTNAVALAEVRRALAAPAFRNEIDYRTGFDLPLPHLSAPRQIAQWLSAAMQDAIREGRADEAAANLVAQIHLPRVLIEDRLAISELIRGAAAAMARNATWEALQWDGWSDEQLVTIQAAWERQDFIGTLAQSLEGERVFIQHSYERIRQSNQRTVEYLYWTEDYPLWEEPDPFAERTALERLARFFKRQVYCRIWRFAWSHQDQRRAAESTQRLLEISRKAAVAKSWTAVDAEIDAIQYESENWNFYDRWRHPSPSTIIVLPSVIRRMLQAETERSMALSVIGIQRYRLRHGHWPPTLDALVPQFLREVPMDCMDGTPLRYRVEPDGGFLLYSIGIDGRDDGADNTLSPGKTNHRNLWERRDFVWPRTATSEEAEVERTAAD